MGHFYFISEPKLVKIIALNCTCMFILIHINLSEYFVFVNFPKNLINLDIMSWESRSTGSLVSGVMILLKIVTISNLVYPYYIVCSKLWNISWRNFYKEQCKIFKAIHSWNLN